MSAFNKSAWIPFIPEESARPPARLLGCVRLWLRGGQGGLALAWHTHARTHARRACEQPFGKTGRIRTESAGVCALVNNIRKNKPETLKDIWLLAAEREKRCLVVKVI